MITLLLSFVGKQKEKKNKPTNMTVITLTNRSQEQGKQLYVTLDNGRRRLRMDTIK